jgi:hypothetical protein
MNIEFRNKIKQFKNVLSDDMFIKARSFLKESKWNLNCSDPLYLSHKTFWSMNLTSEKFFNHDVLEVVKNVCNKNFQIIKVIANAQSTLQDGSPHVDEIKSNAMTFILYANDVWDFQWGGQTIFFDRIRTKTNDVDAFISNSDDVFGIYPVPNTAVLFPSNIFHYGMGPNRDYYDVRYTIAFHLLEI